MGADDYVVAALAVGRRRRDDGHPRAKLMKRSDRNWTIVSMHYMDLVPISERYPFGIKRWSEKYVVYEPLKSEAEKIVEAWLDSDPYRRVGLGEVYYYPRNYVDLERDLRTQDRVIS
jgi:hypothetical protein